MKATVYNRGQMVLPIRARKEAGIQQGDILEVRPEGQGRILLVRLERPKEAAPLKVKFIRRKGRYTVATTGRVVTPEMVRAAMEDIP
jgi:AbrB family looped-hinge helix DNA binding protein